MAGHDRAASPRLSAAPPAADGGEHSAAAAPARAAALFAALAAEPYAFDFYQALRRLECAYREQPRIGSAQLPSEEALRLAQEASLMAAASTLARFEPASESRPARLTQYFFGLLGPEGALPLHLTDYARQRLHHHRDPTLLRFLDLFHHRLLSLFYRAWASAEPTVEHDRPESDRFVTYVGALFGLGMPSLWQRDALPDHVKLFYAGLLAGQTRHAAGLCSLIEGCLRVPAQIEEFVGEWVSIADDQRWSLGAPPRRGGVHMGMLGQSSVVGSRVWARQHRFRVVLGPLAQDQFRRMLPGMQGLSLLVAVVRNYIGDELKWDVRLVLRRDQARPLELGVSAQLGRTTWLVARAGKGDWNDLVLDPLQEYGARGRAANQTQEAEYV